MLMRFRLVLLTLLLMLPFVIAPQYEVRENTVFINQSLFTTSADTLFWRLDGTNAPPSADWDMGSNWLLAFGLNATDWTNVSINPDQIVNFNATYDGRYCELGGCTMVGNILMPGSNLSAYNVTVENDLVVDNNAYIENKLLIGSDSSATAGAVTSRKRAGVGFQETNATLVAFSSIGIRTAGFSAFRSGDSIEPKVTALPRIFHLDNNIQNSADPFSLIHMIEVDLTSDSTYTGAAIPDVSLSMLSFAWGSTGQINDLVGQRIALSNSSGKILDSWGLIIQDMPSGGTQTFAIQTGSGLVEFGDSLIVTKNISALGNINATGNISSDWLNANNLNITGTSYLGDFILNGNVDLINGNLSAYNVSIENDLAVGGTSDFVGLTTHNGGIKLGSGDDITMGGTGSANEIAWDANHRIFSGTTGLFYQNDAGQASYRLRNDVTGNVAFVALLAGISDHFSMNMAANVNYYMWEAATEGEVPFQRIYGFPLGGGLSYIQIGMNGTNNDTLFNGTYGDFVVDSNVRSTKNITAVNVFLPSHIFVHAEVTLPVLAAGQWRNVTFDDDDTELKARLTHISQGIDNDTFTIVDAGIYSFSYNIDFIDSAPNPTSDTAVRILRNDIEINGSVFESDASRQNTEFEIGNTLHAEFNVGDTFKLQFTSDETTVSMTSHSSFGVHPDTAVLTAKRFA